MSKNGRRIGKDAESSGALIAAEIDRLQRQGA